MNDALIAMALSSPFVDDAAFLSVVGIARDQRDAVAAYTRLPWSVRSRISPFFDAEHYVRQVAGLDPERVDPLTHFVMAGVRVPLSPHPLIDAARLVRDHAPLFPAGPAIGDLCRVLAGDLADPSVYFDVAWYREQLGSGKVAGGSLRHFLTVGAQAGLRPNPFIDPAWYGRTAASGAAPLDAVAHFVIEGDRRALSPGPAFDSLHYLQRHGDVAAAQLPPLAHYLQVGRDEGRVFFPMAQQPVSYAAGLKPRDLENAAEALIDHDEVWLAARTLWSAVGPRSADRLAQARAAAAQAGDRAGIELANRTEHALRLQRLAWQGRLLSRPLMDYLHSRGFVAA